MDSLPFNPTESAMPNATPPLPILLFEIDLKDPIPALSFLDTKTGRHYSKAISLIRLHTQPLGLLELGPECDGMSSNEYAQKIWRTLGQQINDHLQQDQLPAISMLDATGLPIEGMPECLIMRQQIIKDGPEISVVIATRNRAESLDTCLQSFSCLDYPHFEIIIVDNAPTNDATEIVTHKHQRNLDCLQYTREDRPGLSWARNQGLRVAQGEIVVFTDDDIIPDPHWLSELVRGFYASPNVICVTGPILPKELESPAQLWIEQFGGFSKGFEKRLFDADRNRPLDNPLYPYAAGIFGSGANLAIKTDFLRSLGGFDPALGAGSLSMSGEEFALFVQVIENGYQIAYEPGALIYHSHRRDYQLLKRQIRGYAVGLTAFLTKCMIDDPKRVLKILPKVLPGAFYAFASKSPKNQKRETNYPSELKRIELFGMMSGPFAYLRSRYSVYRMIRGGQRSINSEIQRFEN